MNLEHPLLRMMPDGVGLRKYPFPYRAAFTIDNDIDGMDADLFAGLYEFLTTGRETPLGPGLKLPLSSSFFGCNFGSNPHSLSFFEPGTLTPGRDHDKITQWNSDGILDTLHTYGCYAGKGGFKREHALAVLEAFDKYGIRVDCWSHHGSEHNTQNLKPQNAGEYYGQGDDPNSGAYHLDLLRQSGMRFYWLSLGGHSHLIGSDSAPSYLSDKLALNILRQANDRPGFQFDLRPLSYPLLTWQTMRDSSRICTYKRFNGGLTTGITANSLSAQLDEPVLQWLIQSNGTIVVYQHLGYGASPGWGSDYLSPATLSVLRSISQKFQQGLLYVDTVSRLLGFSLVQRCLQWSTAKQGQNLIIDISSHLGGDATGETIGAEDLAGQCFLAEGAAKPEIYFEGNPIREAVQTGIDAYGMSYTMIPLKKAVCLT